MQVGVRPSGSETGLSLQERSRAVVGSHQALLGLQKGAGDSADGKAPLRQVLPPSRTYSRTERCWPGTPGAWALQPHLTQVLFSLLGSRGPSQGPEAALSSSLRSARPQEAGLPSHSPVEQVSVLAWRPPCPRWRWSWWGEAHGDPSADRLLLHSWQSIGRWLKKERPHFQDACVVFRLSSQRKHVARDSHMCSLSCPPMLLPVSTPQHP